MQDCCWLENKWAIPYTGSSWHMGTAGLTAKMQLVRMKRSFAFSVKKDPIVPVQMIIRDWGGHGDKVGVEK
jgi:hypothetical protein